MNSKFKPGDLVSSPTGVPLLVMRVQRVKSAGYPREIDRYNKPAYTFLCATRGIIDIFCDWADENMVLCE